MKRIIQALLILSGLAAPAAGQELSVYGGTEAQVDGLTATAVPSFTGIGSADLFAGIRVGARLHVGGLESASGDFHSLEVAGSLYRPVFGQLAIDVLIGQTVDLDGQRAGDAYGAGVRYGSSDRWVRVSALHDALSGTKTHLNLSVHYRVSGPIHFTYDRLFGADSPRNRVGILLKVTG